jgi:hypothetical protein
LIKEILMTIPRKLTLQEQLVEEKAKQQTEQENKPQIIPAPKPVLVENPEVELRRLNAQIELDSKIDGYKSFKEREQALKDGETELEAEALALGKEREKFESEQAERVSRANTKLEEAKKALDLYKTKATDADNKMEQAQKLTSEAERIIKNQSESEKEQQEKLKAYENNLTECLDLFGEMATVLSKHSNPNVSIVGRILFHDVALMGRMQNRGCSNGSVADVIACDCDRVNEACQILQDSNSNLKLLNYLSKNVDYLTENLKISWQHTEQAELK